MRFPDFGSQLIVLLVQGQEEIQQYLEAGVERALATLGETVIEEAARLATQKIHEDVKHYLLYGAGGQAIRAAVHHALAPLTLILQAAAGEGGRDDSGIAHTWGG